jgi:enterochelin esterase family protein
LSGTNLYYAGYQFEHDARLDYKIVVDGNWILDPLNPNTCSGGYGPNSELSMLGYVQPPEIQSYDIPHGTLHSTIFSDTTQGRSRPMVVYTPPGYAEGTQSYRSIYFHDGNEQLNLGLTRNVLDLMISQELIPPVIAVFVDPLNRNNEYAYDYEFMDMFVSELVPWIDTQYRTMPEAEYRAVAGVSLGGLASLLFTIQHPEVFGNCGAYSPAVWIGDLIEQYEASPVLPVKIYMDAGTYEPSIYNSAIGFKGILEDDQWNLRWREWHEGHSWGSWRAHLDEALTFFWPMVTSGIDDRY